MSIIRYTDGRTETLDQDEAVALLRGDLRTDGLIDAADYDTREAAIAAAQDEQQPDWPTDEEIAAIRRLDIL